MKDTALEKLIRAMRRTVAENPTLFRYNRVTDFQYCVTDLGLACASAAGTGEP